jgi:hypothetical protein
MYYQTSVPNNNKVNFMGNINPDANGGVPHISFQGSSQPVNVMPAPQQVQQPMSAPVNAPQSQMYTQKVVDTNGNVNVVPVQPVNPIQQF